MLIHPLGFEWHSDAESVIRDPILASIVCQLGKHVDQALAHSASARDAEFCEAVINVCRSSQHLRLHAGDLARMETKAKTLSSQALDALIECIQQCPPSIEGLPRDYQQAVTNIRFRRSLMDAPKEPVTN